MKTQSTTVHFSLVDNKRDASIVNHYDLDWYEFADILTQGHKVVKSKDTIMFSPWLYKTVDEDYEPRRTEDGDLYLVDGKPVIGRLAENVKGASMICLDFDGEMSLEFAKNKFAQYMHVGYTSYGHKSPEKNHKDCFRIVLPLSQFVTPDDIKDFRKSIYTWADGVDTSSLSIARSFFIPACPQDRVKFAQSWKNDGCELFDVKSFDKEPAYVAPVFAVDDSMKDEERQWIVDSLASIHVGYEPTWYTMAIALYSNDFTYHDFVRITMSGFMKQKSEHDCEKKWQAVERKVNRTGNTISAGYLINLLKEHGIHKPLKGKRALHEKMMGRA